MLTCFIAGPEADASYSKLLVSCLRILIDIANASRQKKGVNTSKSDVKDEGNIDESAGSNIGNELIYYTTFAIQYASLVQSAFALFSKVLPQALAKIDGASSSEVGGALKQSGNELRSKASLLSGQTTEKKLCQHIFLFVSALATFNPSEDRLFFEELVYLNCLLSINRFFHEQLAALFVRLVEHRQTVAAKHKRSRPSHLSSLSAVAQ